MIERVLAYQAIALGSHRHQAKTLHVGRSSRDLVNRLGDPDLGAALDKGHVRDTVLGSAVNPRGSQARDPRLHARKAWAGDGSRLLLDLSRSLAGAAAAA